MQILNQTKQIGHVKCTTEHLDPTGGQACAVKFAALETSSSEQDDLVAAVSGKKIRVLHVFAQADGAGNLTFFTGTITGADNITGAIPVSATAGTPLDVKNDLGLFETDEGEALGVSMSANDATGFIVYAEV